MLRRQGCSAVTTAARWGFTVLWATLPLSAGPAFADALDPTSSGFRTTGSAALWLGWAKMPEYLVLFSLYGGALTLTVILVANHLRPIPALKVGFLADFDRRRQLPYGIALAAAALSIFPDTRIVALLH